MVVNCPTAKSVISHTTDLHTVQMDVPGFLHGLLRQVNVPVGQVEEGKGHWEENAGVFVDRAGAGQLRDRRKR